MPINWTWGEKLILAPKASPNALILMSGQASGSAKNLRGSLLLLAREEHPEVVYLIWMDRAKSEDWPRYATVLNDFVDEYVIAPGH